MKKISILLIFLSFSLFAREKGQTEITTEEGIEVFQKEKYYLLKKNVIIDSDDFLLSADLVKAFFEEDLYDIKKIESEGNVKFSSSKKFKATGERLNFSIRDNLIHIYGNNALI